MKVKRNLLKACLLAAVLLLTVSAVVQAQFTFTTNNGSLTIMGFTGISGNLVVPGAANGYPVTGIAHMAFYGDTNLTSITISDSVTSIGYRAFGGCSSMTNIIIGSGVANVGARTFWYCSSLFSISIGSPTIGINWFDGATNEIGRAHV